MEDRKKYAKMAKKQGTVKKIGHREHRWEGGTMDGTGGRRTEKDKD